MNLLPVGSIVRLVEGKKRLMIHGILQTDEKSNIQYDYTGVLYPEGYISEEYVYLFNHDDIEEVAFIGFADAEFQVFRSDLSEKLKEMADHE